MDKKDKIIQTLLEENAQLKAIIAKQTVRIEELEKRLGLNSSNSSKPPSGDGFKKRPPPKSLREKGKNSSGGQKGHAGKTLQQVTNPDKTLLHRITQCPHCRSHLNEQAIDVVKRQVFDIPPVKIEVTEHQAEIKICPCCNKKTQAEFPQGVNAPAQYGSRLQAQAAYLSVQHYIPEDRLQTLLQDLYGVNIATATLVKFNENLANNLHGFNEKALEKIKASNVKHADETGLKVTGKTFWLHVASNDKVTYYHLSPKRKSLIEGMIGILVHDHWKPYYKMRDILHALCNAHHLRELQALIDYEKEAWAKKMRKLLQFMCKYRGFYSEDIPKDKIARLEKIYDRIVAEGLQYHAVKRQELERAWVYTKKRYPGHNLLLRLQKFREDVLRFLHNPAVPFTNNQAERDLRMMKLKQKISGGFRTYKGAEVFVRIRTLLSTARKQEWNIFQIITDAVVGEIPSICAS